MDEIASNRNQLEQNLAAILLGVSMEEMKNHPEAAQEVLLQIYGSLEQILTNSDFALSAQIDTARSNLNVLKEILKAQGINTVNEIEKLPDMITAFFLSPSTEQHCQAAIVKLRTLASQTEQPQEEIRKIINGLIHDLIQDLNTQEECDWKEKQKERCEKMAKEAIAESFRNLEFPSLADGFINLDFE